MSTPASHHAIDNDKLLLAMISPNKLIMVVLDTAELRRRGNGEILIFQVVMM